MAQCETDLAESRADQSVLVPIWEELSNVFPFPESWANSLERARCKKFGQRVFPFWNSASTGRDQEVVCCMAVD
jgi:hypothetical protein